MYHVLVVDDEKIIREGLVRHIPWHEHHMQVVATASNATMAMEIIRREQIDILVTDIKMPGASGFDLIHTVLAENFLLQVIVISSYDDFAYAQHACTLDSVCDYVLKPIDVVLFGNALDHAVVQICKIAEKNRLLNLENYICLLRKIDETGFNKQQFIEKIIEKDLSAILADWQKAVDILVENSCSIENAKHFCFDIISFLENTFATHNSNECIYLANNIDIKDKISSFEKKETLFVFMRQELLCICKSCYDMSLVCKTQLIVAAIVNARSSYANRDFNLASLALELNVTPNYLSLKFREETGVTFTCYLTEIRINKAKKLLENPSLKIAQIAMAVGFSDEKYFIRVFKSLMNTTPKQFRQTLKNYKMLE